MRRNMRYSVRMSHYRRAILRTSQSRHPFATFSKWTAFATGHPFAFMGALCVIAGWALMGSYFHYSDTWQLVINTCTTVLTFLMVFLIQNTQNRDSRAIHLKLDELIMAIKRARNKMIDLEEISDEELNKLEQQFRELRDKPE